MFASILSHESSWSLEWFNRNIRLTSNISLYEIVNNPTKNIDDLLMFIPLGAILVLLSYKCRSFINNFFYGTGIILVAYIIRLFGNRGV